MSRQRILGSLVSAWGATIVAQGVLTTSNLVPVHMVLLFGLVLFVLGLFVALRKR